MPSITIRFIGLCIHIRQTNAGELPLQHRVVMLANPEPVCIDGHELAPHVPRLLLPRLTAIHVPGVTVLGPRSYQLDRVSMRIANEDEPALTFNAATWGAVRSLTPPGATLELNTAVAYEGEPPASVYFDLNVGRFSACKSTDLGAIGTSVVISTDGPPILEISPFDVVAPERIEFRDGDVLFLTNVALHEGRDDRFDFLLNYGIATGVPPDASAPEATMLQLPECKHPEVPDNLGPSCSNSNFP